jgi:hypothetical protein
MLQVAFDNLALLNNSSSIMDAVFAFGNRSNALRIILHNPFQCVFSPHRFVGNQDPVQTDFLVDISSHKLL